jgi:uncharacterized flavoprotein (TIGR03862 family)
VFERMPSTGRKFLMAGLSGLNLTHAEDWDRFVGGMAGPRIGFGPRSALSAGRAAGLGGGAGAGNLRWLERPCVPEELEGVAPASGLAAAPRRSRGRVPAPTPLDRLRAGGDCISTAPTANVSVCADAVVLALGGGSWGRLGSDGSWVRILARAGIRTHPLRPANCGLQVAWSQTFLERFEGSPLKRIAVLNDGRSISGEAVVTATGLEGGAVYAVSAPLREAVEQSGWGLLEIDLRPDLSEAALATALSRPRGKLSTANFLRKSAGLSPVAVGLLREGDGGPALPHDAGELARLIKHVPVRVVGTDELDRAISTAGGIAFDEIDEAFMLRRRPGVFAAGEMLDWEAPTGGYLLQACFATGVAAALGALAWASVSRANDRPSG